MSLKLNIFASMLATAGLIGLTLLPTGDKNSIKLANNIDSFTNSHQAKATVAAQISTPAKRTKKNNDYSSQFVGTYNKGCSKRLKKNGIASEKANLICSCSIEQMQEQHSQTKAITILIKASKSKLSDTRTGMPLELSQYFDSCTESILN
ncbi:MAG: hypothetical protein QNJ54_14780 [Prochloraceae cyanobacterium]|nr:hypothetical protein [Prochloraceae cyanobacterium]